MSSRLRYAFNVKDWKPTEEQWKLCLRCVQKEESDRCNRFHFINDCKSSLIGRLLMRKAVNESLQMEYDKIRFARTSSGKPYLIGEYENKISFNVSHNGDFCVLASELNMLIGVDVMKIEYRSNKPLLEYFELMRKQFSSHEWEFISLPGFEREQLARFYRLWCLKESYVKAVGTGIACNLQTLSFSCRTPCLNDGEVVTDTKLYKDDVCQENWKFEESLLNDNHCIAVAVEINQEAQRSKYYPEKFKVINFEELMKTSVPFGKVNDTFWEDFISKKEK